MKKNQGRQEVSKEDRQNIQVATYVNKDLHNKILDRQNLLNIGKSSDYVRQLILEDLDKNDQKEFWKDMKNIMKNYKE